MLVSRGSWGTTLSSQNRWRITPSHRFIPRNAQRVKPKKSPNPTNPDKFCPRDARPGEKGQPPTGEEFLKDIAKPIDSPLWFKIFQAIRALVPSAPPVNYWAGSPDA